MVRCMDLDVNRLVDIGSDGYVGLCSRCASGETGEVDQECEERAEDIASLRPLGRCEDFEKSLVKVP